MICAEVLNNKYVIMRSEYGKLEYWLEHACGYTDSIYEAGVYSTEDCAYHGVRILTAPEIKAKRDKMFVHYAIPLLLAIKLYG